jgi:HAD superfamily hydrolase (TIGR01509 family)
LSLVIFDCDGVLVDSEPLVNRIEAGFFTAMGAPMNAREACAQFKGKTVEQVADALQKRTGRKLSAEFGYDWGMTTALGLVSELQPVPGVDRLIEDLQSAGVKICVASQSPLPRVLLSLKVTRLDRFFGGNVFTASMVARPKPAPDLFLFAAEHMGEPPIQTIVIEDSPSGVVAGCAAGMRVYGYAAREDAGALGSAGAATFTSMDELRLDRRLVENLV